MNTYLIATAEEKGVDIVRCQQSTRSAQAVCDVDLTIICVSGKILQVEGEKRWKRRSSNPAQSNCYYWGSHHRFAWRMKKKIEYDHLARLVCHLLPLLLPCHAPSLSLSLLQSLSLFLLQSLSCTINTEKKKHRSCRGWRDSACPKGSLYLNACQRADCLNLSV